MSVFAENILEFNLVDIAASQLHARGGRMTSQRRLILETLAECTDHPTAEEIYSRARQKYPGINLSTVYRTLRWLEKQGLVNARLFHDERGLERFDPIADHGEVDHHHFRCENCNQIIEFSSVLIDEIKGKFVSDHGGRVIKASLTLYGLCAECAGKKDQA